MLIKLLSMLAVLTINHLQAQAEPLATSFAQLGTLSNQSATHLPTYPFTPIKRLDQVRLLLSHKENNLNPAVIDKVLTTLECAKEKNVDTNVITVIDYSLPSNEKRLWVFDLIQNKLLFHTYVSHGIKSGELFTNYFSNKNNSKASSLGVYNTDQPYNGRHGLSLRLQGLESGFNDNASSRSVVMHGGWYVEESFIKKYGRPGRSWGCPAVPDVLNKSIINTIKEKSLMVMFYPNDTWFAKSKFLNCNQYSSIHEDKPPITEMPAPNSEAREPILFADLNKDNTREENEPVVVITAANYEQIFHSKVPLTRMLRRQINNTEYVALKESELKQLNQALLDSVHFVIPVVKLNRGYYETEMQFVMQDKIKEVQQESREDDSTKAAVVFNSGQLVYLKSTSQFIRWLGL